MIIQEVSIKNFRSHKNTSLQFKEGIHVIVGDNGSGKTSILDALNFALFKQKSNKEVNIDNLIRRGASECIISVVFHSNGRKYKVIRGRKIGKASGSAIYRIDNGETLIARGEDEITKEVEEILKVNGELFTSAIYIKQGEIDSLISATPSTRKEHIGKLLGAEDLERAYQRMYDILKEYRIKLEGYASLPEEINERKNRIKEEEKEIEILSQKLIEVKNILKKKKKEFKSLEEKIGNLEKLQNLESEKKLLESNLDHIRDNIEKITSSELELEKTKEAHRQYIKLEEEIERLRNDKNKLFVIKERLKSLERELGSYGEKIKEIDDFFSQKFGDLEDILPEKISTIEQLKQVLDRKIKDIKEEKRKKEEEKESILSEINEYKGQNTEILRAKQELEKAADKCPTCGQTLSVTHKNKLIRDYSRKIRENQNIISEKEVKIEEINEEIKRLSHLFEELKGVNLDLLGSYEKEKKEAEKKRNEIKESIKEQEEKLRTLRDVESFLTQKENEKEQLRDKHERYISAKRFLRERLPDKERYLKKMEVIKARIERIKGEMDNIFGVIGYVPKAEELWKVREAYRSKWEELTKLEKIKTEKESIILEKKKKISIYRDEIEKLTKRKIEGEQLAKFVTFLEKVRSFFHKDCLQKELRIRARPLIERYTREIFDRFNLPYSDLKITDDFNIELYGPHGKETVDMLSGGEKIAAALALRIGIAKALSGRAMELIILDEPTIHLDAQRRQELVEIIRRLSSIPQTIVVTHDKEFEQAADVLIAVEKVNGISTVKQLELILES